MSFPLDSMPSILSTLPVVPSTSSLPLQLLAHFHGSNNTCEFYPDLPATLPSSSSKFSSRIPRALSGCCPASSPSYLSCGHLQPVWQNRACWVNPEGSSPGAIQYVCVRGYVCVCVYPWVLEEKRIVVFFAWQLFCRSPANRSCVSGMACVTFCHQLLPCKKTL